MISTLESIAGFSFCSTERHASGAGNSRSDAGAQAISSRLHAIVRRANTTSLWSPVPPIPRSAPLMSNGSNPNVVCKFQVEYRVGKPPEATPAQPQGRMVRKPLRMLLNAMGCPLHFLLEVSAESRALVFIVGDCCTKFCRRIGMKKEQLHEYCARNSANT